MELTEILDSIEILIESSKEDFGSKQYVAYEKYVTEYNEILNNLHSLEMFKELKLIEYVPSGKKAASGVGITQAEIAKHREVVYEATKLYKRVRTILKPTSEEVNPLNILELLFVKFHSVARQLRVRHSKRDTLDVNDEYDVQDLLHALLKIYFDDIRVEEWTPSYAGSSKRMDFLLKNEGIVVEVKKTRDKLSDKEVGEQLIIDTATYEVHPNCKTLVCFVYDPEGRIGNPKGLENDLSKESEQGMNVYTYIFPK
ncbi:hypothetical protein [Brevibacillus brevis]|uniref:Uncharacterized protein n=1 Tax=Brevibacillus brevis TaxID=1393 RepID=A0ABY9T4P9_BREBE|nr:hypothetical protein [Brevibacillus brevis]WNC14883.1 hypothetical protein RGB73_00330 [Brevibacillus brevis]